MGIYSRYSAAFLILALLTPKAFSAVRVPVIQNDEYIRQVLSRQSATTGFISTPAGQVAFFGADKVFAFSAGDSVRPTVREVKGLPNDGISFPYGPGAAYPTDPNLTPAAATKVKVKPQVVVPKANILAALKNGLKVNPGQLALTATVAAALAGVDWVIDQGTLSANKPASLPSTGPEPFCYRTTGVNGCHSLSNLHSLFADEFSKNGTAVYPHIISSAGNGNYYISLKYSNGVPVQFANQLASPNRPCPGYLNSFGECLSGSVLTPVTDSDFSQLDPWVSQQSAEWLGGLIRDVCNGSLNPGSCYSGMVDRSKGMISGPALLAGPITTKTTQTPNADGTTTTRTETTKTDFKLTYGKDYFDVETEKKTTVTEDGQLVSETTEKDDTPAQDFADTTPGEEQQPEPEPEYTFGDSPFPPVEPFYQQKYPDGLSGVWSDAKLDIDNSDFLNFLRSFVPTFSGSCPAFSMSFAIGNVANFGMHEFQSLCYVFDFVKIILMVSAAFLARQITFGG